MIEAIAAVQPFGLNAVQVPQALMPGVLPSPTETRSVSFGQMLSGGIETTNAKIAEADRLVVAFVTDSTIPAHQVTLALEEARLSLEFMIQVRNRMVEGFQQIMNMQV